MPFSKETGILTISKTVLGGGSATKYEVCLRLPAQTGRQGRVLVLGDGFITPFITSFITLLRNMLRNSVRSKKILREAV